MFQKKILCIYYANYFLFPVYRHSLSFFFHNTKVKCVFLHILKRDANGEIVLDIPALPFEEAKEYWEPACERIKEELYRILSEKSMISPYYFESEVFPT